MHDRKTTFIYSFIFLFTCFSLFNTPVYGADTCTENTDCQESINENTYNLQESIDSLNTYLNVDDENPVTLITTDDLNDFNDNMTEFLQVWGIFSGMLLFSNFFILGLFLYKR